MSQDLEKRIKEIFGSSSKSFAEKRFRQKEFLKKMSNQKSD